MKSFNCTTCCHDALTYFTGQSPQGHSDAVGQPDHGHAGLPGPGHRAAQHGTPKEKTVRQDQGPHLPNHDKKHYGTFSLSAYCCFCSLI